MADPQPPATPDGPPEYLRAEWEDLKLRLQAADAQTQKLRAELRRIETELGIAKRVIAAFNSEEFPAR